MALGYRTCRCQRGMAVVAIAAVAAFTILTALPSPAQTLTVLHTFTGGADGAAPVPGMTMDAGGNLYGTASDGGSLGNCSSGCGTAYKLVRHGGSWQFNVLYEFTTSSHGPANPGSRLIFGPDGALYGTTVNGGNCNGLWCGTVYKLQPPASFCHAVSCPWVLTVLHEFSGGDDGAYPYSDVAFDRAGNIYGTTWGGGLSSCVIAGVTGCGTVFKLSHNSDGTWTNHTLYEFQGGSDGAWPYAGLVLDQAGNLYGATYTGGIGPCNYSRGCGSVFELSPSGSGWVETTLHQFTGEADGGAPLGALIFDGAGNLYGGASYGGAGMLGTVYELTPTQGAWTFNVLYTFTGTQANGPSSALTLDAGGNLYGTSEAGGVNSFGTVFKLTHSGGGWTYSSLHDFDLVGSDGGFVAGSVVLDANGTVYGPAASGPYNGFDDGVLFEITQ